MQSIRGKCIVSTSSNVEIDRLKKERKKKEDEQFGSLANFQFSTSAILFASFTVLLVTEQPKRKVRGL